MLERLISEHEGLNYNDSIGMQAGFTPSALNQWFAVDWSELTCSARFVNDLHLLLCGDANMLD